MRADGGGLGHTRTVEETSVSRVLSSGAGEFLVPMGMSCEVGFLLRPVFGVPRFRSGVLTAGMLRSRAGMTDDGLPSAVPGARHLGLLAPRSASGLGPGPWEAAGPAPTAFNRAGEKLQATGGELPRVSCGAGPRRPGGLALPLIGEEGQGAPAAMRADGCAGQAASGWQRGACWQAAAPEATAASQLVPWTTTE